MRAPMDEKAKEKTFAALSMTGMGAAILCCAAPGLALGIGATALAFWSDWAWLAAPVAGVMLAGLAWFVIARRTPTQDCCAPRLPSKSESHPS